MKKNVKFIKNLKKYIKDILKTMLFQAITLIILIGAVTFAVSRPSSIPSGELYGGKFINYFNNITGNCSSGQAIYGFNNDFSKKCTDFEMP